MNLTFKSKNVDTTYRIVPFRSNSVCDIVAAHVVYPNACLANLYR